MKNYPMTINGWEFTLDPIGMTYWKQFGSRYEVISLFWMDTVKGDEGYYPGGDCWIGISADGNTLDDAVEMLDIMPFTVVETMRRAEAEKELIKYMETH